MPSLPLVPRNYAEVLVLAQAANCLTWHRDSRKLSLVLDNLTIDRRTCVDVRLERGLVEVRTLRGFDSEKNRWSDYCGPAVEFALPDRKGAKALLSWLAAQAQTVTGCPNPANFSLYRPSKPATALARAAA